MNTFARWLAGSVFFVVALSANAVAQERLRLIVETDAGGDPDDEQSLVRFLIYACEWDVEGIIANRPVARSGENRNAERTGLGIVRRQLDAYGQVVDSLLQHRREYPSKELLWERTVSGYADSDDGVNLIISAADRADSRPIWFLNWGTDHGSDPSSLKRALDRVLAERGTEGYARFKDKFLLCSDDQFGAHTKEIQPPWRLWVYPFYPDMDGGRWYHRFSPITARAGGFDIERDVRTGHGPLGALYPTNTHLPQKEGDSGTFMYLIPTGMNDPMQPTWGSWAGRFGVRDDVQPKNPNYYWANLRDTWNGTTHRDNTLKRWAEDIQNDFRARMDWCVNTLGEANHRPVARLDGFPDRSIVEIEAAAGSTVRLDARSSSDPDGNALGFEWIPYPEAGTCMKPVALAAAKSAVVTVNVPNGTSGTDAHIVLRVVDDGSPPLASYRRVILRIR